MKTTSMFNSVKRLSLRNMQNPMLESSTTVSCVQPQKPPSMLEEPPFMLEEENGAAKHSENPSKKVSLQEAEN